MDSNYAETGLMSRLPPRSEGSSSNAIAGSIQAIAPGVTGQICAGKVLGNVDRSALQTCRYGLAPGFTGIGRGIGDQVCTLEEITVLLAKDGKAAL